ncbi:MAG: hypothetical protein WCG25_05270 [bacterium]
MCPLKLAHIKAVIQILSLAFISTFLSSSRFTISKFHTSQAKVSIFFHE